MARVISCDARTLFQYYSVLETGRSVSENANKTPPQIILLLTIHFSVGHCRQIRMDRSCSQYLLPMYSMTARIIHVQPWW